MNSTMISTIYCPNCGSLAERHHLASSHLTRTQCEVCDYLMVTCDRTGRVIEAYAPGVQANYRQDSLSLKLVCEARS